MTMRENIIIDSAGNIQYICPACGYDTDIIFQDNSLYGEHGDEYFQEVNLVPITVCCNEEI